MQKKLRDINDREQPVSESNDGQHTFLLGTATVLLNRVKLGHTEQLFSYDGM